MLTVSDLYIYPIKSLGGIRVERAILTDRGFQYDRRWMLVDMHNRFLTQRELPEMALLSVEITEESLVVKQKMTGTTSLDIPFAPRGEELEVTVWDDTCPARRVDDHVDQWFSEVLGIPCKLVYMPDTTQRRVDEKYALNREITSFADGYPLLLIGQASLDDLNKRLSAPLPMDRFRPSIVFTGGAPYQEDELTRFELSGISFYGVKRCARCVMVGINQETAVKYKEPLKTLSTYRQANNKIFFGQNLLYDFTGERHIAVGDVISTFCTSTEDRPTMISNTPGSTT